MGICECMDPLAHMQSSILEIQLVQPFLSFLFSYVNSPFRRRHSNWLTDDLWSSFYPFLTEAIDKGDNRRLGKKPLFTSAQVILPSRRAFIWFIYALVLIQKPDNDQVLCDFILHALGMMIRVSDDSLRPSEATCPALTAEIQCRISSRAPRYRCTACQTGEAKRSLVKWSHAVKTRT